MIEYGNELLITPGCVYHTKSGLNSEDLYADSLESLISKYLHDSNNAYINKGSISINIYNPREKGVLDENFGRITGGILRAADSKNVLGCFATQRKLLMNSDFSEIYAECFTLENEDGSHNYYAYDYDILYNSRNLPKKGNYFSNIYNVSYNEKMPGYDEYYKYAFSQLVAPVKIITPVITNPLSMVSINKPIYCVAEGTTTIRIVDKYNTTRKKISFGYKEDYIMPVSSLYKAIGS